MDSHILNSFKMEIESMFEKSFQELSQKNNLNKAILSNLMDAASAQSQRINQLDIQMDQLRSSSTPNVGPIRKEVDAQEKVIHDNFDAMMFRLGQIEQGVVHAQKVAENNNHINKESEQGLNQLLKQMEKIEREEGIPEYHGSRDQLFKEVEQFDKLLQEETEKLKGYVNNVQTSSKTTIQPLQTFQTKVAVHTKNNEQILKEKLRKFAEKLRTIEKKVQESHWRINNEVNQAKSEQQTFLQEMNKAEIQMAKLRQQLENTDQRRKQEIHSSAMTLDNIVEQMLGETKKLQVRVDNLRRTYESENEKFKKR